ncbi:hypothetical protein KJ612_10245 [Myxococcota bacterium]|nr:hypothetical protein [Myxococcota bacterium]
MSETPQPARFRCDPEPLLAHRLPRRIGASGILNPPGRWRSLLTFAFIILLLLGSAFITAFLVYRQSAAQHVRQDMNHILLRADLDLPDAYRQIIPILRKHADLLGREETGERMARYVLYLALFHGDVSALEHAAEARSLAETRSRRKGQYYSKVFEIARLLVERKDSRALLEAEKALIHFPRSDLLLYELSLARMNLGSWEAAHASLEMALILKDRTQIPMLVEQAVLERRRGQISQALQLVDEVLRRSPHHPIALLERNLCLALSGRPFEIPDPAGTADPIVFRFHLLHGLRAMHQGDFAKAREHCMAIPAIDPESAWCRARLFLRSAGQPADFIALIPQLQLSPFPDIPCMMMDFYLMTHRPQVARQLLETCIGKTDREKPVPSRVVQLAILEEDVTTLAEVCPSVSGAEALWTCIDGATRLKRWDLLEKLERHPQLTTDDRILLRKLVFTDAFGLVTTTEPPADCSPRGLFLRTRWARRALRAGQPGRALKFQESTIRNCPYSIQHQLTLLELLVAAGMKTDALALSEGLQDLAHAPSLFRLGSVAMQLELPQTALYWSNALMHSFPDDYRGFLLSAIVERNHNRWKQFQENIETAKKLSLHAPVLREHQATWEAYQGRYAGAERILREQMTQDPDAAELWATLAQMIQHEQPLQASRWYQSAVELWIERHSPAAASRVMTQYAESLDPITGKAEISRIVASLKALPELHPAALAFLSRHANALDRHAPEVIERMEEAVRLAPCNAEYRLRLGNLLYDVDRAKAEEQYQKILTLRQTAVTEQAKERLQRLHREAPPTQAKP